MIIGAGNRGYGYAAYALAHPEQLKVVGLAEPIAFRQQRLIEKHNIPQSHVFDDWQELLKRDKLSDAVIISLQDHLHAEAAVALADKGYHILLEKPMATSEEDCRRIIKAVEDNNILFAVCHVMRYTSYTTQLKALLNNKLIGDIINIQHLEPVGFWHQAHSYVRGNWRNEKDSSFMLLTKSCHDVDWISYLMNSPCKNITSYGNLKHFSKNNKPKEAGDHCLSCDIENDCAYSSKKIYLGRYAQGERDWPLNVIVDDVTEDNLIKALQEGPYGRCVYNCDNDVVDHQVVNFLFENNSTASFTMTAFSDLDNRQTRIFGSEGELSGDGKTITHRNFLTGETTHYDTDKSEENVLEGHGGGDYGLMKSFVSALINNDASEILSGPRETLHSHLLVFAAEKSRKSGGLNLNT